MHIAGIFLIGMAIAALIAIFAVSNQSRSLMDEVITEHSSRKDDQLN
jgi:Tfp pilus assembly protein FimT